MVKVVYARDRAIQDYTDELQYAQELKREGATNVDALTAGEKLAGGRKLVPIDEYIAMWQDGLNALQNGADPELYNY